MGHAVRADPVKGSWLQSWISALYTRKGYFKTAVAIANKHARIFWPMLARAKNDDASAWQLAAAPDVFNCTANKPMKF